MILLFALLYLSHSVQGTNTVDATTSSTCPELDGSYRSVWSILGSCAVTLVICVWHAVHLDVPGPGEELVATFKKHALFVIGGFLAPEFLIGIAMEQWIRAYHSVMDFRERGYEWSMTHSYFSDTGGFVFRNKEGHLKVINALEFLELCEAGKIMNPFITENDINDKSKSDAVSKAIFIIQLLWFMLQIAVRHFTGLTVTLVELDTLCMSVLAVFYLLLWWNKPLNAGSPHVFDEAPEDKLYSPEELSKAWKSQSYFLHRLRVSIARTRIAQKAEEDLQFQTRVSTAVILPRWMQSTAVESLAAEEAGTRRWFRSYTRIICDRSMYFRYYRRKSANRGSPSRLSRLVWRMCKLSSAIFNETIRKIDPDNGSMISFVLAWSVLGGLHLIAWNYGLPTKKEAKIRRGASLALTASGYIALVVWLLGIDLEPFGTAGDILVMRLAGKDRNTGMMAYGIIARFILVVLMFLSLRALPCSAHQTVPWVQYVPHI